MRKDKYLEHLTGWTNLMLSVIDASVTWRAFSYISICFNQKQNKTKMAKKNAIVIVCKRPENIPYLRLQASKNVSNSSYD